LAAYRPGGKLVILEGGGDSETDLKIIQDLFPAFATSVNLVSGGNKSRVRDFHALLERTRKSGVLPAKVYSITDKDFDTDVGASAGSTFQWDRFHIENYLLEPRFVLRVMRDLRIPGAHDEDDVSVHDALRTCAERTLPSLLRHSMDIFSNARMVEAIRTRSNPEDPDPAASLRRAVESSLERVNSVAKNELSLEALRSLESAERDRLESALRAGSWINSFRGRDVLKRFVDTKLRGVIGYTAFRDLLVARMRDESFEPVGMKIVIDKIVSSAAA
jgi:hypothetical protein